ncbi:hypothetical protein LIZ10_26895, partial [Escherichia coli]|nr:hypothetical protein [Escherichia coli]
FTEFMAQALAGQPAETFATPVDNGKIGGPNGDWGLGGQRYVPSTNNGTQQQQQNEQQQTAPENTKTPEQPQ